MSTVSKPTEQESRLYYYGLPSCPRLVARTDTDSWAWESDHNPKSKILRPAKDDALYALWRKPDSKIQSDVLQALDGIEWTAVDIMSVGYKDDATRQSKNTILVSVSPDSISWEQAIQPLLACKAILEQHGIHDVHLEMRESQIIRLIHVQHGEVDTCLPDSQLD